MKYEIIVITRNSNAAQWGILRNRYYIETTSPLTIDNCRDRLRPLNELYASILKVGMIVDCIAYRSLDSQTGSGGSGLAVYKTSDATGRQPLGGEMKYRYALQLNLETNIGRHHKNWIRGAVDSGDVNEGENNEIGLIERGKYDVFLSNFMSADTERVFADLIPRPIYTSPKGNTGNQTYSKMYCNGVANSNAPTRIRFGLKSDAPGLLEQMLVAAKAMQSTYDDVKGRFISDGNFTFADVYFRTLGALGAPKVIEGAIKDYFKDADGDENNGKEPPATRFGATCVSIYVAFLNQKDEIERELPELQKVYKPYTDPFTGQDYIKKEDMEPYLDLLKAAIEATAHSVTFDAYNSKAYPEQKQRDGVEQLPDFVKLAL
jgi:hypothetical protein